MSRESKNVLSHAAVYLVARGGPGILALLGTRLFTEKLSPAAFGQYALVLTTVDLLNALFFQWVRLSLIRYLPGQKEDSLKLKSTMMAITCGTCVVLGVVAAILSALPLPKEWRVLLLPCWIMLSTQAIFELCGENIRSSLKPIAFMWLQMARSLGNVALGLLLIVLGAGWWGPLCGVTLGMAAAILFVFRRDWSGVTWKIDREQLRMIAQYGLPLSMTVALSAVIASSDRYLIAAMMGKAAAGDYSAAVNVTTQTLTMLLMVIYTAMFPLAVRAFEQHGKEAAQDQMRSNAALLMGIGIPCVVGMSVLAPGIARIFLGQEFRDTAASIIPIIATGAFLAGFKACHFDCAFQFAHRTIYQMWIVLFVAVLNFALNWLAIPRFGINGAATASALAYVISIALTAWLGRRHFRLPFPLKPCLQVLSAGAIMGAALWPLHHETHRILVLAAIAGGAAIYGLVLLACDFLGLRAAIARRIKPRLVEPATEIAPA